MSIKCPTCTSRGQMHNQKAAVQQTFHFERNSFLYFSALIVTHCAGGVLANTRSYQLSWDTGWAPYYAVYYSVTHASAMTLIILSLISRPSHRPEFDHLQPWGLFLWSLEFRTFVKQKKKKNTTPNSKQRTRAQTCSFDQGPLPTSVYLHVDRHRCHSRSEMDQAFQPFTFAYCKRSKAGR